MPPFKFENFHTKVMSFAAFFCYSEASNLTLGDIVFYDTFIKVFVEKSKTDRIERVNGYTSLKRRQIFV